MSNTNSLLLALPVDPMLVVLPIVGTAAILFFFLFFVLRKGQNPKKNRPKDRNTIVREANRKLAQNPKDADALLSLGNLYYREANFEKSMKTFEILMDLCATNSDLNEFEIIKKYGLSALKIKNYDEAYKNLVLARTLSTDDFEINHNLGYLEYLRKNYEKASGLLQQAIKQQPDHIKSLRYLGHSFFRVKKYKEALSSLLKSIELEPDDKESLFVTAQCYHELSQNDQAIKIFTFLRADPELGPSSALYAGTIHLNTRQYPAAIMDFEIGLRHEKIKPETFLEMKYRLATAYVKQQDLATSVKLLTEIQNMAPGYKDVPTLLNKYGELNSNQNLQIFLMSVPSEFVSLCRKITESYIPKAKTKIIDISVHKSEYADILAEVSTPKWEDLILFRFVRTTGQIGELMLRDLYGRIKELKAGRGFCITAGDYSDGAHQFVEARLIDLIDKTELMSRLNNLDHRG